jgi:hypothetical protein
VEAAFGIFGARLPPNRQWLHVPGRTTVQRLTPCIEEPPRAVVTAHHPEAALVHGAMVEPAQHEIEGLR